MMASKATIYLNNHGLSIYRWNRRELSEELHLTEPKTASSKLAEYFAQHGNQPIRVVVDLLEEMYALESLPHLGGRDRNALIQRKKNQSFSRMNFVYHGYKGRSVSERKDDQVLFAAIAEDKLLMLWLQALYAAKVSISGIFSVTVLTEKLMKKLQGGGRNKLLISISADSQGIFLRQSYFKENIMALSRFKFFKNANQQKMQSEIKEDINRSRRFITGHFRLTENHQISAFCFCSSAAIIRMLEQIDFASISLSPTFHLTSDFARLQGDIVPENCGLSEYVAGLTAQDIYIQPHYKEPQSSFYYNHYLFKNSLNIASILIILSGLVFVSSSLVEKSNKQDQINQLRIEHKQKTTQLANTQNVPLLNGFNPFEIAALLQARSLLAKKMIVPLMVLKPISQVLDQYPTIILINLEWGEESQQPGQEIAMNPVDILLEDPGQVADEPIIQTVPIKLQARIENFDGNFRYALALIERFSTELAVHKRIAKVKATKLPVDLSTDNEISGAISEQNRQSEFILEMQWQRNT